MRNKGLLILLGELGGDIADLLAQIVGLAVDVRLGLEKVRAQETGVQDLGTLNNAKVSLNTFKWTTLRLTLNWGSASQRMKTVLKR